MKKKKDDLTELLKYSVDPMRPKPEKPPVIEPNPLTDMQDAIRDYHEDDGYYSPTELMIRSPAMPRSYLERNNIPPPLRQEKSLNADIARLIREWKGDVHFIWQMDLPGFAISDIKEQINRKARALGKKMFWTTFFIGFTIGAFVMVLFG